MIGSIIDRKYKDQVGKMIKLQPNDRDRWALKAILSGEGNRSTSGDEGDTTRDIGGSYCGVAVDGIVSFLYDLLMCSYYKGSTIYPILILLVCKMRGE